MEEEVEEEKKLKSPGTRKDKIYPLRLACEKDRKKKEKTNLCVRDEVVCGYLKWKGMEELIESGG